MEKELDKTERILVDILKEIKVMFEISECNKTSIGYIDSYNVIKKQLEKYNPKLKIKKIYNK